MREDIWKLLTGAIIDVLQCDESELDPETSFVGDLGADSLDAYQILLEIQDRADIELPEDKVQNLVTLQNAYDLLAEFIEED
ncbi:MAG: acyl carrier protein [Lachnospiraceae bacterium]|nr:acyl carrier protein [Lachnospiraceae bacterium]